MLFKKFLKKEYFIGAKLYPYHSIGEKRLVCRIRKDKQLERQFQGQKIAHKEIKSMEALKSHKALKLAN